MSRRTHTRSEKSDDDYKNRFSNKRSDRSRSPQSSYGITSESYNSKRRPQQPRHSQSASSKSSGFIPDEDMKKFFVKPTGDESGFWTTEDYTFRDTIAKDVRNEIEDDIASKGSDEESEEDPEIAEYADRADMDSEDDEQKKTIVERLMPLKKDDEKKKDTKSDRTLTTAKTSS